MRNRTILTGVILGGMIVAVFIGPPVQAGAIHSGSADQSAVEFQKSLGVPLEDAGGGTHALLERNAQAAKASLIAEGYLVNQIRLNYDSMSADIFIAYKTPTTEDQTAALSAANDAPINFVTVMRSAAEAERLQARIDTDWATLTKRGIAINTTGIGEDGSTVFVTLTNGTFEQADYIVNTYGPGGLKVTTAAGPIPQQG